MNKDSDSISKNEDNSNPINAKFHNDPKKDYINIDIEKIISDLEYYEKLKEALMSMQIKEDKHTSKSDSTSDCCDLNTLLDKTNKTLLTIDSVKTQICRLPLNPCQKEYFSTYIVPLLTTMDSLSRVSYNIGTASALISDSKTLNINKAELQNNLNMFYCLNRKCQEIYCTLEKNIDILICENTHTK